MYEFVKRTARKLLPLSFLRRHERSLRNLIALRYRGDRYECNICGFRMSAFVALSNGERLCPRCGSLPRTRRLWTLLEGQLKGKSVLHFSPPRALRQKIQQREARRYVTTDYEGEFLADKQLNIEAIEEAAATYDLIICYHVLEHVRQDQKALRELYRILKPGGLCLMQTPFKEGDIYENDQITSKADRLKHFGQEDHLRIYSVSGLKARAEQVGFDMEIRYFESEKDNRFGFKEREQVLFGNKRR